MSDEIDKLMALNPFSTPQEEKAAFFLPSVIAAMTSHYERCEMYRRWCDRRGWDPRKSEVTSVGELPFLPVNIFKRLELNALENNEALKVLRSSATSSQIPSSVALDKITRDRQMKVLAASLREVLGPSRRPFIVFDVQPNMSQRNSVELSARVAGIRGYLMAASKTYYVMNDESGTLSLDIDRLKHALAEVKSSGSELCMIAYTYVLYQHVVKDLLSKDIRFELPDSTKIIHFGGWKKLEAERVSKKVLLGDTASVFGMDARNVFDIYGFTEQLGVIYPDDSDGIKRAPVYSEVVVRDPVSLQPVPDGETGLLEFITPIPNSYPGAVVLTDDIGRIVNRSAGNSGWSGTGFEILGRANNAEVRGCGDTLPSAVYRVT